jgi:crotonobetainyl-CoA:carnitine CoA-transferase CaiB-like acyl-CoA transferase
MLALDNLRVIDMTQALAGPYCTQLLGDMGADVIKVEPPAGGDMSRRWVPPAQGGESVYFMGTNRNKRGVTVNWKTTRGAQMLRELVATADVFVVNVPTLEKLAPVGLDWATLHAGQPSLIYTIISGYGQNGPKKGMLGYDMVAQGEGGAMSFTGFPGEPPLRFPTAMADITAGLYAHIGILTALAARSRTGLGQLVDIALLDSQLTWLAYGAWNFFATGQEPERLGNEHPTIVPYGTFETADGWINIAVGTDDQWLKFGELLGFEAGFTRDSRFATVAARCANRDLLVPEVRARLMERTSAQWNVLLAPSGVPYGPVNSVAGVLNEPQIAAREMIVALEHPAAGLVRGIGNPVNLSDTPVGYRRPAPMLGQHNTEVWGELGYSAESVAACQRDGAL